MLRWLWRNLSSLLLALVLAITVWVAAVSAEDPVEERTLPNPVPIELRSQPAGLMIVNQPPETARVTLRSPQSVWNGLSQADVELWVDLASATTGEGRYPVQYRVGARPVEITRIEPANLTLTLEPTASAVFPVEINIVGEPPVGFRATAPQLEPAEVTVIGPDSAVSRIATVASEIDISGRSQALIEQIEPLPLDENGNPVAGVTLQPATIRVTIGIEDLGGYRSVVVLPKIEGELEPGYQLTQITVSPTLVRVFASDPLAMNELSGFVETEPVSLTNVTDDFERRVSLDLPTGVSIVGEQSVLVRVSIDPIETSITITREVEVQGLEDGLYALASPQSVSLILTGPLPVLDGLQPRDVRVIIDVLGLAEGSHQLTPEVIVALPEVNVQSVLPDTIELTITDTPPPTPTAVPTQE
jgi:YbbR domain-containing protein